MCHLGAVHKLRHHLWGEGGTPKDDTLVSLESLDMSFVASNAKI